MSDWGPDDEAKHPRHPAKSPGGKGGEWAKKASARIGGKMSRGGYRRASDISGSYDYARGRGLIRSMDSRDHRREMGDVALGDIYEQRGFNAKPEVLTEQEMDERIAAGWMEMYRGAGLGKHADLFRDADTHWPGWGSSLNGTFATLDMLEATDHTAPVYPGTGSTGIAGTGMTREEKLQLQYWPGMLRMALRPDARVADYYELMEQYRSELGPEADSPSHTGMRSWPGMSDRQMVMADLGRYAALLGYDAVRLRTNPHQSRFTQVNYGGADHYVLLNRGAVAVQEAHRG